MTSNFGEIEAASALTAMKSLKRTYENLPTPPSSDVDENQSHPIMDTFHAINKDELIPQITNFSKRDFSNIFMIADDALLKIFLKRERRKYPNAPADMFFIFSANTKTRRNVTVPFKEVQNFNKYLSKASVACDGNCC